MVCGISNTVRDFSKTKWVWNKMIEFLAPISILLMSKTVLSLWTKNLNNHYLWGIFALSSQNYGNPLLQHESLLKYRNFSVRNNDLLRMWTQIVPHIQVIKIISLLPKKKKDYFMIVRNIKLLFKNPHIKDKDISFFKWKDSLNE